MGFEQKVLLFPNCTNLTFQFTYQADGIVMIFLLLTRKCLLHGYSDDFLVFNLNDGMTMMIIIMKMTNDGVDDVNLTQYHIDGKSLRCKRIVKNILYLKVAWT